MAVQEKGRFNQISRITINFFKKNRVGVVLGLMVFVAIFIRLPTLMVYYDSYDEGVYLTAARMIYLGKIPYKDFFLAHFPAQEYLIGFLFLLYGGSNLLVARLLGLCFVVATGVLIFYFTRLISSEKIGLLASFLFLYSPWGFLWGRLLFKEPFMTFFTVLSCYLYLKAIKMQAFKINSHENFLFILFSGFFIALAVEFKITAICVLLGTLGFMIFEKYRHHIALYSLSFIITFCSLNLPFILIAGNNFIYDTVLFHLFRPEDTQFFQHGVTFIFFNFSLIVLGFGFSIYQFTHEILLRGSQNNSSTSGNLSIFPLYWLCYIIVIFSVINSVYYWYFYLLLPPLAIQASQSFFKQWDIFSSSKKTGVVLKGLLILFLVFGMNITFFTKFFMKYDFEKIYVGDDPLLIEEMITFIQTTTPPSAKIFTLNPSYLFYSNRAPSLNIIDPYGFTLAYNLKGERNTFELFDLDYYLYSRRCNVSYLLYLGYSQERLMEAIEMADIIILDSLHSWFLPGWTINSINDSYGPPIVFKNDFIIINVYIK